MARRPNARTLFVSDLHLGTPDAQAQLLLNLMQLVQPERLYLVGDVFDLIAMKRRAISVLDSHQQRLVRHILRLARTGCEVIYIPGNHDAAFRTFCGETFRSIEVRRDAIHVTRDGRRLLVSHGDEFDGHFKAPKWKLVVGEMALHTMRRTNRWTVQARRRMGRPYWSLSAALKRRSGNVKHFAGGFRQSALDRVRREGLDGYIGGHIHIPFFGECEGFVYCNDGDWVENCTALVEEFDGRLRLVDWQNKTLVDDPRPPSGYREKTETEDWLADEETGSSFD